MFRFRAPGNEALIKRMIGDHGVADLVEVGAPLPYREALREMMSADALLLLQASSCNSQIPAKLYEYLRAGKPIVALTDPSGDTARTLRWWGHEVAAPLDDPARIESYIAGAVEQGSLTSPPLRHDILEASRLGRTRALANLLDRVVSPRPVDATKPEAWF